MDATSSSAVQRQENLPPSGSWTPMGATLACSQRDWMIAGPIIRVGFQTPLIHKEAGGSAKETCRPHAGALLPPNPQVRHLIRLGVPRWPLWQPATQNKAQLGSTRAKVMHVRLQNELVPPVGALRHRAFRRSPYCTRHKHVVEMALTVRRPPP